MQEELRVDLEDGKYTVVFGADCRLHALRYGEQWRDCVGDNLILALAQEVQRLRTCEQDLVADWNATVEEGTAEITDLRKALFDSALTALAAETQAEEAYQKQLVAEKRVQELEEENRRLEETCETR